jgi:peptide/nickel transport system permease protein
MNYYIRRLGQSAITILCVVTITFILIRLLPGGPMAYVKGQLMMDKSQDQEMMLQLVESYVNLHPKEPIWKQYIDYMSSVLRGDLGTSIRKNKPVASVLLPALPWTIFYGSISLVLTYVIAITAGGFMAYHEGSKFDSIATVGFMVSNSIPYFVIGMLLLSIFGFQLGWFPTGNRIDYSIPAGFNVPFVASAFHHAALLIVSFTVTSVGGIALAARGNSMSIIGSDYLRVGQLRGLSSRVLATQYVARNAVLPLYTQFMVSMGYVFGGSTVLEVIYRYEGAGFIMLRALETRDVPLIMGSFIVLTLAVVLGVLVADLTYGLLDPRTTRGGAHD